MGKTRWDAVEDLDGLTVIEPGVCRVCGCTDEWGCDVGCSWADAAHTLCSECEGLEGDDADHISSECSYCGATYEGAGEDCGSCAVDRDGGAS